MRKKLVSMLLVVSMVALVGCGSDKKSDGGKKDNQSTSATENGTGDSAGDQLQDFVEDNINGENVDAAIAKLNPTYKVNTKDVSEYYFANPNISIGKSFMEMTNVSSVSFEEWVGYNEDDLYESVTNEYASLEEINDRYLLEKDDEQIDIVFSEGANFFDEDKLAVYDINAKFDGGQYIEAYDWHDDGRVMKLKDVLAGGGTVTYGVHAQELHSKEITPTIQLKEVFNIDFEGNAEESMLHLKELWGEPSAIECSKNWGITYVYWIFESDTIVHFELNSVMSDETNIGSVYITWTDSAKRMEEINTEYISEEYDDQYWYKRADVPKPDTSEEIYPANLPQDIVLTFGDKSVVITKDNWQNIFAELGVTPNNADGNGYYLDATYPGKKSQGVVVTSNKLEIKMPNFAGMNEAEISVFGLTPQSTGYDMYEVFGSEYSYEDSFGEYTYYRYDDLIYEGVSKIEIHFYSTGSKVVEIWWE